MYCTTQYSQKLFIVIPIVNYSWWPEPSRRGWSRRCGGSSPWSWSRPTPPTWPPSSPSRGWSHPSSRPRTSPSTSSTSNQNNITLLLHSMLLHFFYLHWIAYIQCLWKEKEYFCSGRCPLSHWPPGPGYSKSRHIFPCLEPCPAIAGILADLCINRSSKIFLLAFAEYIIRRRVKWEDPSQ